MRDLLAAFFIGSACLGSSQEWRLVFADEFNWSGGIDPTRWGFEYGAGGWGNSELQAYTDRLENCRVTQSSGVGRLIIEARRDFWNGNEYTSARLFSRSAWTYGRMVVRAKLPGGRGTWPAIWMLPQHWSYGGWPDSGEIDIMELVGYEPTRVHASVHTRSYNHMIGTHRTASTTVDDATSAFHEYSVEWRPDRIEAFVDGIPYFRFDREGSDFARWPFDRPFQFRLNVAVGGTWGGAMGVDPGIWPKSMEIDYVRVYRAESRPYQGSVHRVPGRIEAEAYDAGGQGFAFHDTDPVNHGGTLRSEGVDVGMAPKSGPYVGWMATSEWLNYTVVVPKAGDYELRARVASPMDGRSFHWEWNDARITADQLVPNTGDWFRWREVVSSPVRLGAGKHVLRFVANGDLFNIDWVEIAPRRKRGDAGSVP